MEIEKNKALKENRGDFEANMTLSEQVWKDMDWWMENLRQVYRDITPSQHDWEIRTDASSLGWGAFDPVSKQSCGSRWMDHEAVDHINVLELRAMLYGLQALGKHLVAKCIKIMTDNTTAMMCVNSQGSTKSQECLDVTRQIWFWALERDNWLMAVHLPGVENKEADFESRNFNDSLEWTLNDQVFKRICKRFGKPQRDLFATRLNNKVKEFCAWKPDPQATAIDAFTIFWGDKFNYAFPPFSLIGAVLQKAVKDKADMILVVPKWPTAVWYAQLLEKAYDDIMYISVVDDTLFLPYRDLVHPMSHKLTLMVVRL